VGDEMREREGEIERSPRACAVAEGIKYRMKFSFEKIRCPGAEAKLGGFNTSQFAGA